jgi:hypothetical protein
MDRPEPVVSRIASRTFAVDTSARLREAPRRVDPNPQLEALARLCKIAGAVVVFALVLTAIMAIDVAIWVPRAHP